MQCAFHVISHKDVTLCVDIESGVVRETGMGCFCVTKCGAAVTMGDFAFNIDVNVDVDADREKVTHRPAAQTLDPKDATLYDNNCRMFR